MSHQIHWLYNSINKILENKLQEKLKYNWDLNAREEQKIPQSPWQIWLILAGRGFGKTRTGAETIRKWATLGKYKRIALIGNTFSDVEQVMITGESGILSISPPHEKVIHKKAQRKLIWPNGASLTYYSAQKSEQLRGPQFDAAWIDELVKFPNPQALWDQLMFSLRLGDDPKVIITTTPKSIPLLSEIINNPKTHVTRGSTFDNSANLSKDFLDYVKHNYLNTKLGSQELMGELLESHVITLWQEETIARTRYLGPLPKFTKTVIGVDPAVTSKNDPLNDNHSNETGIIVVSQGADDHFYVRADLSLEAPVNVWVETIIEAYYKFKADLIIGEINQGGDLIKQVLMNRDNSVNFKAVRAVKSKELRALPVSQLYLQGIVHHVGFFEKLEKDMCNYHSKSSASPDRLDALVWAITELTSSYTNAQEKPTVWSL